MTHLRRANKSPSGSIPARLPIMGHLVYLTVEIGGFI